MAGLADILKSGGKTLEEAFQSGGLKITGLGKTAESGSALSGLFKNGSERSFSHIDALGGLFNSSSRLGVSSAESAMGIGKGAMLGAGLAMGGSMAYSSLHFMSPNNAEANDPIKNILRGGMIGAGVGALAIASHNAPNLVKEFKNTPSWLKKASEFSPMVKNVLASKVTQGAIGVGILAGSGQFDLTRPVNPVYAPNIY